MQLYPYYDVVRFNGGSAIEGASVVVTDPSSGLQATVYDKAGNAVSQPLYTDAGGNIVNGSSGEDGIGFWAPAGRYKITVTYGAESGVLPEVHLGPPVIRLPDATDLNNESSSGTFEILGPVNSPDGASSTRWWYLSVLASGTVSSSVVQQAIPADSTEKWIRIQDSGVWGNWVKLAWLDNNGLLPTSVLPPLSITSVSVVASESEQLALTVQEGDVAIRTDTSTTYMHNGGTAGTMDDWTEIQTPALYYFEEVRDVTTGINDTVPVHQWKAIGAETDIDLTLSPKGQGAITITVPDGTATGGNKRGQRAVDLQYSRTWPERVASGTASFASGYNNEASGNRSFAHGSGCRATSHYSLAIGDLAYSFGKGSVAMGYDTDAMEDYSYATGTRSVARYYGARAHSGGYLSLQSGAQYVDMPLVLETTDDTPSVLTSDDNSTPTSTTVPSLQAYRVVAVTAWVVARDKEGGGDGRAWRIEGVVNSDGTSTGVRFIGTPTKSTIAEDSSTVSWDCNLVVNTTRKSVEVEVVGEAGKTIHWMCKFDMVEIW